MNIGRPKNNKEWFGLALLGASAVFVIVAIAKVGAFTFSPMRDPNSLAELIEQHNPDPNHVAECIADRKKVAEEIKKNNPFTPPPPKPQPPKEITGILGDSVLMQGKWYKVGDMMAGARILAIEATFVEVEWEGKKIQLARIKTASAGSSNRKPNPPGPRRPKRIRSVGPVVEAAAAAAAAPVEEDDLAWLDIPAALKEKFRVMWNQMSDEQKQQAKERWNSMTDEQKQQAIDAMSSRM